MNCQEIHNQFIFYLDGELSPKDTIAFEKHIQECNSCKNLLNQIKATYQQVDIPDLSDNFTDTTLSKIQSKKNTLYQINFIQHTRRIAAVIAFMLISTTSVLLLTHYQQNTMAETATNAEGNTEEFFNYYFADLDTYDIEEYYIDQKKE